MIKILLVQQTLPVLEEDFRLLCVNVEEKGKLHIYVNTRWLADYWQQKRDVSKDTEKLLIAELQATPSVEETLTNWFTEDSFMWLKTAAIQSFLQYYNLIDSPDIFSLLETETAKDGSNLARVLLVNELDYLLSLE